AQPGWVSRAPWFSCFPRFCGYGRTCESSFWMRTTNTPSPLPTRLSFSTRALRLPFWLFNFEEMVDVIFGARPGSEEEIAILAEEIPRAKANYSSYRAPLERSLVKKPDPRAAGYSVDTPVPYRLADLVGLLDERMGKLENRSSRMI